MKDEGCVSMHASRAFHGTWNDTRCDQAKPYVCKISSGLNLFFLPKYASFKGENQTKTYSVDGVTSLHLRETAADSGPRRREVSAVLGPLRPLLLRRVRRPAGLLLAGRPTLLPIVQGRPGVHPQPGRGGVHQEPQLHRISQHVDRPHQGRQL